MLWKKISTPPLFFFLFLILLFLGFNLSLSLSLPSNIQPFPEVGGGGELEDGVIGVLAWDEPRRQLEEEEDNSSSSLILVANKTRRRDPFNNFKRYTGGYNISNHHYWASVGFTAAPFFIVGGIWFIFFGFCLAFICLCFCCCRREPYGYSRVCYAVSLISLILFTVAAIAGCVVLYTGEGKFHSITTNTLDYVVSQANVTTENLRNVSDYLAAAKNVSLNSSFLPTSVQNSIDDIDSKINSSASTLSTRTQKNSKDIDDALDLMGLSLIILAAVMLALAFIGFLCSIFGLQCLVYSLVVLGWILVAGTFILCGVFLLIHNVVGDTCIAMDEWVQNPTAKTALDDIIPCVDNTTAQETLNQTKSVTYELVNKLDGVLGNISNRNFPPVAAPLYYNQSGPLVPLVCNPFNADYSTRKCAAGEVDLSDAIQVWMNYTCQVSSSGICKTPGRLIPSMYSQMAAAVNISYGLYRYGPFLVGLEDCTFVRQTFNEISSSYCPKLRRYTEWIYVGMVLVSAAVMLSLVFWVIYARERRHRVYTKQHNAVGYGGLDKD